MQLRLNQLRLNQPRLKQLQLNRRRRMHLPLMLRLPRSDEFFVLEHLLCF
jgi:hypothetical protein